MLSDEEKKAIDDLFALIHINGYIDLYKQHQARIYTSDLSKWQNGVKTLLNLIEKQQKEIEELKEDNKKYIDLHYVPYEQYTNKLNEINKKWEDKIKAKIEELENDPNNLEEHNCLRADTCYVINVLQSLLEKE